MKYGIVKCSNNEISFLDEMEEDTTSFCQLHRSYRDSKCVQHYKSLFSTGDINSQIELTSCPYGLNTSTPFGSNTMPRAIYGFRVISDPPPPVEVPVSSCITLEDAKSILTLIGSISTDIRQEEMGHFEAALHDARHLNHSITQHAERILARLGYPPDKEWDMPSIQQDEIPRRALSIYAASRDLSDAISMHEISQDISRAKTKKIATQIHRLFYRQIKISTERFDASNLQPTLGPTQRSIMLTPEFRLIPKILIDNAIKYSSRGSTVSISFTETPHFFKITCANEGPLIRPDEYGEVFTRGGRGSNKSGISGRGIGLWLAKIIVDANTGLIEISTQEKSREYSGRKVGTTSITIRLP